MNRNHNTKNKLLKNIALTGCLLSSFAGTPSQLQAAVRLQAGPQDSIHAMTYTGNMAAVRRLIGNGDDVNQRNSAGLTPLFYANDPMTISSLCNLDADVDAQNPNGDTPLHLLMYKIHHAAATNNNLACIRQLLLEGVDIRTPNNRGRTPLTIASDAVTGNRFRDGEHDTAITPEARQAYGKIMDLFRTIQPIEEAFHRALINNNTKKVRQLLTQNADPNKPDKFGHTPLQSTSDPEIAHLLIQAGAAPNKPNQWSDTPLHCAMCLFSPNKEYVKVLLLAGANPNIPNRSGLTATDYTIRAINTGITAECGQPSGSIDNEARIEYAKILPLLHLHPRLWEAYETEINRPH
jgi:ankyrin repeat protein